MKPVKQHKAVPDKGRFRPMKNYKLDVDRLDAIEEQTPDWLVMDYVPDHNPCRRWWIGKNNRLVCVGSGSQ